MKRWKGLVDFVFDMVDETTSLVERTHIAVTDRSLRYVPPIEPIESVATEVGDAQKMIARGVYDVVRGVNKGVRTVVSGIAGLRQSC